MEVEGRQIAYLSATIVPDDDYFTSVLEAPTDQLPREALARAGIPFQRISPAIRVARWDDAEGEVVSRGDDDLHREFTDARNHQGAELS
jgi:hypothetical protein